MPSAFQSCFGPSAGHFFKSPVSRDRAARSGPCHCGQSNDRGRNAGLPAARTASGVASSGKIASKRFRMGELQKSILATGGRNREGTRGWEPIRREGRRAPTARRYPLNVRLSEPASKALVLLSRLRESAAWLELVD